jgi:hypothetical protein
MTTTRGNWNAQRYRMVLFDMHKPVIAQVHGHCLAGGTDIALLCDMVIAADDARFGFPPARDLGALPNNMWLYNVGPQWAKRLTMTGDTVTGKEAQQLGLVMKSVPREHLEAEVEQLADRLALIDPDLLSANKRIINLALELQGARTLQRLAAENDVRGHNTAGAAEYRHAYNDRGLAGALRDRDQKFGDGRARVNGPELRTSRDGWSTTERRRCCPRCTGHHRAPGVGSSTADDSTRARPTRAVQIRHAAQRVSGNPGRFAREGSNDAEEGRLLPVPHHALACSASRPSTRA